MKVDKASYDFYVKLCGLFRQFQAVGNNYNQLVKAVKSIYGDRKALGYLYRTAEETVRMNELIIRIIELAEEFKRSKLWSR